MLSTSSPVSKNPILLLKVNSPLELHQHFGHHELEGNKLHYIKRIHLNPFVERTNFLGSNESLVHLIYECPRCRINERLELDESTHGIRVCYRPRQASVSLFVCHRSKVLDDLSISIELGLGCVNLGLTNSR